MPFAPEIFIFVNVGLVETINRAAGSLQKDQNLNDIPDKTQARNALQLGTAATATLTTSTTDDTTGRVLKVGDRGLGKGTIPALRGFDFNQYWFTAGETLFIETNSAINFPSGMPEFANTYVYVNVVGIRDSNNDCTLLFSRYNANVSYLVWRIQEGASRTWQVRKIPATAADIGAIPKDPIGKIVNNGTMASASTPGWWLVSLDKPETVADFPKYPNGNRLYSYGFMFVARSGNIWLQQYFTHTGASAHRQTWNGDMSEQTPWVIDYSTANPPPATDLSAYATQQWVLQNFVQNIRVSAAQERKFWDGNGWSGNDSAFATAIWMVGGSSNVGGLLVRYVQKQINNNWYNITE
ncbi:tail fiber protein [Citrobacter phage Chris1]|uniref:hypothetical protein n=1 Tax=Citrobacter freundii complex TaxID=1344959 RepID=UPI0015EA9658|nr:MULTISPECIES: hypothetical protein [Citrobacter freundii complex]EJG2187811.1 hypothetical protein [Citrobacter freundii]QLW72571.1 hypothetical protein HV139_14370 [Citrobacter freundii]UMB86824.1 hypothetical protein I9P40_22895 [Citrobacter portucalensis]UOL51127.1 tail fiber protein [Citrobacter phage Chris1]